MAGTFQALWEPTAANLLNLISYVHANPLRAGLKTEIGQYRWSSYGHYARSSRRKALVVCLYRNPPGKPRSHFPLNSQLRITHMPAI
ncbi:MAG TPA: hypothetical protein VGK99_00015 [Acidobacteriota bacterium]